jgi:hypothetical protein
MTAIVAILDVEIRRTMVPGQHGQKVSKRPISTNKKLVVVVHACHSSYGRK